MTHVGDLIRLRRFCFRTSKEGELIGNENSFSNWMLIGLEDGEMKCGKFKHVKNEGGTESIIRN